METRCPQWDYRRAWCPNLEGGQWVRRIWYMPWRQRLKDICAQKAVMGFAILVHRQGCKREKYAIGWLNCVGIVFGRVRDNRVIAVFGTY